MILKTSSSVEIYVYLFKLKNPNVQQKVLSSIVQFLCLNLPKVRKILVDKLVLLMIPQYSFETLN
jgi:hypothetical protein